MLGGKYSTLALTVSADSDAQELATFNKAGNVHFIMECPFHIGEGCLQAEQKTIFLTRPNHILPDDL